MFDICFIIYMENENSLGGFFLKVLNVLSCFIVLIKKICLE